MRGIQLIYKYHHGPHNERNNIIKITFNLGLKGVKYFFLGLLQMVIVY